MGKSKIIPLACGLIGGEVNAIYGQFEVFLENYSTIKIMINRKPYSGRSNIHFSVPCADLQDIIDILQESKEQLDAQWLSRVAIREREEKEEIIEG
ncbi:MAG: hypothetical protein JSV51_00805 [Candidatus Bathyarchaeota archaeon]|nr:MAG: hypothetical protein JSV51_00805 [Candidatus Bathyarchaeota archaeon]